MFIKRILHMNDNRSRVYKNMSKEFEDTIFILSNRKQLNKYHQIEIWHSHSGDDSKQPTTTTNQLLLSDFKSSSVACYIMNCYCVRLTLIKYYWL